MKKLLLSVLCLVMCLSLVACGKDKAADDNDDDVAGSDWRTTGVVVASGTLTLDRKSTDVLVCLDKDGVKLYYDEPEQRLFTSADFHLPFKSDPRDKFESISLDDTDSDGYSEIVLMINGEKFKWSWDGFSGRFVCWETVIEESEYAPSSVDFVAYWYCADGGYWLRIYGDDTWDSVEESGDVINSGYLTATIGIVKLYMSDGELVSELELKDGVLVDNDSRLKHVAEFDDEVPQAVRTNLEKGGYNG